MLISVAAIGFGRHFRRSLLPNLLGCERFRLVAIAEREPDARQCATCRFPGLAVVDDAREALEQPVDAVLISTDPAGHVELTDAALRAGKHVFVEKPLGTRPERVRELARLARDQERVVGVGTMWRHAPAHRVLRDWLRDHDTALRLVHVAATFPTVLTREGWDLDPRDLAFYDMFIHPIDWVRHLLGGISEVEAVELPTTRSGEILVSLRLTSSDGQALATISAATRSHAYQVSAWLHTSHGALIEVDTDRLRITTTPTWSGTDGSIRDRATLGWETGQLYRGWARKGYAEELTAFADRIASGVVGGDELDAAADTLQIVGRCLSELTTSSTATPA